MPSPRTAFPFREDYEFPILKANIAAHLGACGRPEVRATDTWKRMPRRWFASTHFMLPRGCLPRVFTPRATDRAAWIRRCGSGGQPTVAQTAPRAADRSAAAALGEPSGGIAPALAAATLVEVREICLPTGQRTRRKYPLWRLQAAISTAAAAAEAWGSAAVQRIVEIPIIVVPVAIWTAAHVSASTVRTKDTPRPTSSWRTLAEQGAALAVADDLAETASPAACCRLADLRAAEQVIRTLKRPHWAATTRTAGATAIHAPRCIVEHLVLDQPWAEAAASRARPLFHRRLKLLLAGGCPAAWALQLVQCSRPGPSLA